MEILFLLFITILIFGIVGLIINYVSEIIDKYIDYKED